MRALPLLLLLCLLSVAPAYGQPVTPTPRPSTFSTEMQLLDQIAARLETMSATDASAANAGVLILGGSFFVLMLVVLVVTVWIARGGLVPIWQTITAERQRATQAEQSELRMQTISDERERKADEYRSKTAQAMQATAESQERMGHILGSMETSEQASQGRKNAVATITQHVTSDGNQTRADVKQVKEKLDQVLALLSKEDKRLDPDITEARVQITEVKEQVVRMSDTGELDPAKVPAVDPKEAARRADVAPEPPDIWAQDNPDNV